MGQRFLNEIRRAIHQETRVCQPPRIHRGVRRNVWLERESVRMGEEGITWQRRYEALDCLRREVVAVRLPDVTVITRAGTPSSLFDFPRLGDDLTIPDPHHFRGRLAAAAFRRAREVLHDPQLRRRQIQRAHDRFALPIAPAWTVPHSLPHTMMSPPTTSSAPGSASPNTSREMLPGCRCC